MRSLVPTTLRGRAALAAAGVLLLAAGCRTRDPYASWTWYYNPEPGSSVAPHVQATPYSLAIFEGKDGQAADWNALWNGVRWADIVIVGEQHDDANAHEVQRTIVEETFAAWPGSAVSLEMLERNEQPVVDAYLRGEITKEEFVERTKSADWAGKGSWDVFYQPIIDAARDAHAPVIAANAPREYVRRARTEGYAALRALPPDEAALISLPKDKPPDSYRERFRQVMSGDGAHAISDEKLDELLRSQRLWDATMADSIVRALKDAPSGGKVVHLVGQFHVEFDGGLVSEIQKRDPWARILTISVQKGEAYALRPEDKGRADLVVYGVDQAPKWRGFRAGTADAAGTQAAEPEPPTWGFAY
ncbi:MAG: ChaN family lipoprotein [Phycisphaerales bacterium]